ncbi:hypothetical protein CCR75_004319 [Bremia lactucae]|uniref:Uncharacterized protein n=1 Tax=Bremia lactucae TaxID=4779 RepID=A0A976FLD3_BRELC|nr:hypothetical protein CCR75_004319 [Bremia lactucae]
MDVGTNVWVKSKDTFVWAAGEVIGYRDAGTLVQVRLQDTDKVVANGTSAPYRFILGVTRLAHDL